MSLFFLSKELFGSFYPEFNEMPRLDSNFRSMTLGINHRLEHRELKSILMKCFG